MIDSFEGIKLKDRYTDGMYIYEVESICAVPTIILCDISDGERISGAAGCRSLRNMRKIDE